MPEIPGHYVRQIESGEFFDMSKLLPQNLHKLTDGVGEVSGVSFAFGDNNQLKLVKNAPKRKIETIGEWTDAFIVYMKTLVSKFPLKAMELVCYMETIRYAATYHRPPGWSMYDTKFRAKAAHDKSLSWGLIDQQLWLRIFTVSPAQLDETYSLFNKGPSQFTGVEARRAGFCHNFNRGVECQNNPCRFRHTCNKTGCGGAHAGYLCSGRAIGQ